MSKFSEVVYTRSGDEIEYARNRPHMQDRKGKEMPKPNTAGKAQISLLGLSLLPLLPLIILGLLMQLR